MSKSGNLDYESNPYTARIPCGYCGKTNCYTKCFINRSVKELSKASYYLCYNCGVDFVDKNCGWDLVEAKVSIHTDPSVIAQITGCYNGV
jgi:hypothetical protein